MNKNSKATPENIKLTDEQVTILTSEINANNLSDSSKTIVNGLITSCLWLQHRLVESKITIAQLKSIFGISTEKKTLKKVEMIQILVGTGL